MEVRAQPTSMRLAPPPPPPAIASFRRPALRTSFLNGSVSLRVVQVRQSNINRFKCNAIRSNLFDRLSRVVKFIDPVHIHIKLPDTCKCHIPTHGLLVSSGRSLRRPFLPVLAVGSGQGSLVTEDEKTSELSLQNVKTTVVSRDDETINIRVDLPGKETQKVFDEALICLSRDAPPVPGFRRSKGGKTSNIPSSILLQMLGRSRVTKFILQEILSITVGDFVKKENLKVNPEVKTTQSESELESSFKPGSAFGCNVILQLEKTDSEEADPDDAGSDEADPDEADSDEVSEDPSS